MHLSVGLVKRCKSPRWWLTWLGLASWSCYEVYAGVPKMMWGNELGANKARGLLRPVCTILTPKWILHLGWTSFLRNVFSKVGCKSGWWMPCSNSQSFLRTWHGSSRFPRALKPMARKKIKKLGSASKQSGLNQSMFGRNKCKYFGLSYEHKGRAEDTTSNKSDT